MALKLITETVYGLIHEEVGKNLYIHGIYSTANLKNENGRIYKKNILEREISKLNEKKISKKCLWSELGHPLNPSLNLERAAALVEKLEWDNDNVMGRSKIIDTPMGAIAKVLVKEGNVGVSSRGLGSVSEGIVEDSFDLRTYDIVSEPSNSPSWVAGIYEGKTFDSISHDLQEKGEIVTIQEYQTLKEQYEEVITERDKLIEKLSKYIQEKNIMGFLKNIKTKTL
jgi:hypothetical protein